MPYDLIPTPPKAFLAIPQLKPEQARPWEGEFHAPFATGNTYIVPVKAVIQLFDSMIEGRGRSMTFPTHGTDTDRQFELTGTREMSKLIFDICFAGVTAHKPWICEGEVNAAEDYIYGSWAMGCLKPDICGCNGPSGPFELKRCK